MLSYKTFSLVGTNDYELRFFTLFAFESHEIVIAITKTLKTKTGIHDPRDRRRVLRSLRNELQKTFQKNWLFPAEIKTNNTENENNI